MGTLIAAFLVFVQSAPTVTIEAPAVPGGKVVIVVNRQKMKEKEPGVKHIEIPKRSSDQ